MSPRELLSSGNGSIDPADRATSKAIQRRTGPTFHLATRVLPSRVREATYVLYAFFRTADDVVDTTDDVEPAAQRAELKRIRASVVGDRDPDDPVLAAFRDLRVTYDVPDEEVATFLDAMERDVSQRRYETFDELETYLRGSSVAVANMMLAVMDAPDDDEIRSRARALAEAFQLTNFLRDVKEDVDDYGRVYLPQRRLREHGVTEADLAAGRFSGSFEAVIRAELERTEARYREGVAGIERLPRDCQFAVLLSAVLYAEHHRLIRERGYDVLSDRPTLDATRRLALLARTWWHWRRDPDPERVFYAVGAVPESPDSIEDTPSDAGDGSVDLAGRLPAWLAEVTDR